MVYTALPVFINSIFQLKLQIEILKDGEQVKFPQAEFISYIESNESNDKECKNDLDELITFQRH